MSAVDEITVLRFPDHEPVRLLNVVAEFESDGGILAERTVVELERCAGLWKFLQRNQLLAGVRVVEHCVAVTERATLDILARHADWDTVGQYRGKRKLLRGCPVDRPFVRFRTCGAASFEAALQLAVEREPLRTCEQRVVDLAKCIQRNAGRSLHGGDGGGVCRRRRSEVLLRLQRRVYGFELVETFPDQSLRQLWRDRPLVDQRARPFLAHRRKRSDRLVHHRLGERRLIAFVVPMTPVTDQIDQEVEAEAHAVFPSQPRRFQARDRIVRVDVDDRNLEAARQAARVTGAVRTPVE